MTTWRSVLETLAARPRVVRIEPAHSQRLPGGRSLVGIEISGWGVLRVGRAFIRPYWGRRVVRFAVQLGTPFRAGVWSLTGYEQREYQVDATLAQAPERAPIPNVNLEAIGVPLGTGLGRQIAARVPASFLMQRPVLQAIAPRLSLVASRASQRPLLPPGPHSIGPVLVEVHMPPVRRDRLSPPHSPTQLPAQESH
jgi:hypothetical protein